MAREEDKEDGEDTGLIGIRICPVATGLAEKIWSQ